MQHDSKFNNKTDTTMKQTMEIEKDVLNPMTWDRSQWKDAIIGFFLTVFIFACTFIIISIFG